MGFGLVIALAVAIVFLFVVAMAIGSTPREPVDPTERVWSDTEKGINCWYVTKPGLYNSNPPVECVPIMEVGGYY